MNDFETLDGSVSGASVILTWSPRHLPYEHSTTINSVLLYRGTLDGGFSLIATLATTATTYTDTPATAGEYQYKLVANIGIAPATVTLQSNVVRASTLTASVLTGSVSGNTVSLSFTDGTGSAAAAIIQRSNDAGVTWVPIGEFDNSKTTFSEALSSSGTYKYRVVLSLYAPKTPDENTQNVTVTSNVVTLAVTGSVHQSTEQPL